MKRIISIALAVIFYFPWIVSGPISGGWAVAEMKQPIFSDIGIIQHVIRMPRPPICSREHGHWVSALRTSPGKIRRAPTFLPSDRTSAT